MKLEIKRTKNVKGTLEIAKNLPDYFNEKGLLQISKDVKRHHLFGVFIGKKMVGFATYKKVNRDVLEITWLGISLEFQRRGIGGKLVQESLRQMRNKYKLCIVKTLADSDSSKPYKKTRAFYKAIGFIPLEPISPYPGWDSDNPCQIFVKPLFPV